MKYSLHILSCFIDYYTIIQDGLYSPYIYPCQDFSPKLREFINTVDTRDLLSYQVGQLISTYTPEKDLPFAFLKLTRPSKPGRNCFFRNGGLTDIL